jgi:hypothetical protein
MAGSLSDLIDALLKEQHAPSWHEDERRQLGIPEDCAEDALLCVNLCEPGSNETAEPLAFVIDERQMSNTMTALGEFLREAFHPVGGRPEALAIIDFMPPLDDFGAPQGISRRWVLDRYTYGIILPHVSAYLRQLARAN